MSGAYAPLSPSSVCWLALLAARNPNKAGGEMFKRHFIFPIGRSSAVSVSPDDGAPPPPFQASVYRSEITRTWIAGRGIRSQVSLNLSILRAQ